MQELWQLTSDDIYGIVCYVYSYESRLLEQKFREQLSPETMKMWNAENAFRKISAINYESLDNDGF